jgi:Flp pilus assembly pilin Flp
MISHTHDDLTDDVAPAGWGEPAAAVPVAEEATPTSTVEPVPVHPRFGRRGQLGASLIEYVLMIAMIAIVCIGALSYFGGSSENSVDHSSSCIVTAGTPTANCP